jgi:large subunit ribosomal protein L22
MEAIKTARAEAKTVRISATKVRLVINLIRGKSIKEAFSILKLTPNGASFAVEKVLKSAVANAEHNYQMEVEKLFVKEIFANEGITMKRFLPKAKGSASKLLKRTSNITVVVAERN